MYSGKNGIWGNVAIKSIKKVQVMSFLCAHNLNKRGMNIFKWACNPEIDFELLSNRRSSISILREYDSIFRQQGWNGLKRYCDIERTVAARAYLNAAHRLNHGEKTTLAPSMGLIKEEISILLQKMQALGIKIQQPIKSNYIQKNYFIERRNR